MAYPDQVHKVELASSFPAVYVRQGQVDQALGEELS